MDENNEEFWIEQIYLWQYNTERMETFYYHLILAYKSADFHNRIMIGTAYPSLHKAMSMWNEAGNYGDDLFVKYKVGHFKDTITT
jgi:hypothetical protein